MQEVVPGVVLVVVGYHLILFLLSLFLVSCSSLFHSYHPDSHTLRSPTFANSTYLSEKASADRNFCLGYMMREEGAFPEGVDILTTLCAYFMYCSIECTVHTLSVVAGTFANGGTCPVTGKKVFESSVVRNCLSVMHSCGMYDYSGTFAYKMGFPCKSGVGGALMIVIPGVCGFCTWRYVGFANGIGSGCLSHLFQSFPPPKLFPNSCQTFLPSSALVWMTLATVFEAYNFAN